MAPNDLISRLDKLADDFNAEYEKTDDDIIGTITMSLMGILGAHYSGQHALLFEYIGRMSQVGMANSQTMNKHLPKKDTNEPIPRRV